MKSEPQSLTINIVVFNIQSPHAQPEKKKHLRLGNLKALKASENSPTFQMRALAPCSVHRSHLRCTGRIRPWRSSPEVLRRGGVNWRISFHPVFCRKDSTAKRDASIQHPLQFGDVFFFAGGVVLYGARRVVVIVFFRLGVLPAQVGHVGLLKKIATGRIHHPS